MKEVKSFNEAYELLLKGDKIKQIAETQLNNKSSRSHTIFGITVESEAKENINLLSNSHHIDSKESGEGVESQESAEIQDNNAFNLNQTRKIGQISLIDLAGSEAVSKTRAEGTRLKEGFSINRSLLALSNVISNLSKNKKSKYINYRDSKLTRIMQPELSGNIN